MKSTYFLPSGIITLAIFILVGFSSCHHEEEHHEAETTFQVTTPFKTDTTIKSEYVCQIHSIQHIELRALEKGYLEKIYVDEGQRVKKGQLMFQIMPIMYQAEYQKALAEVHYAEIEYKNTKALADSNIVSPNELALAEAKLEKARAEMSVAKTHLDFTQVKAPFDGIMDKFQVRLGSLLEDGELLTSLSDNSEMWVYFNVPEAEYLDYITTEHSNKQQVNLIMANNKMFDQTGVIETIEADFNPETGNIAFRAKFPNPKGILRHGETGNILIPNQINDALIIPQKATFEVLDKKYVFVVDENNVIHSRKITVSQELTNIYVIAEGLSENDKILIDGLRTVKNEDKIKYDLIAPEKVMASLDLYAE